MNVLLSDGSEVRIKLREKRFDRNSKCKSKFQESVGHQLLDEYPHDIVYQEVFIPTVRFYLDFFIPSLKIAVECHGRQHTEHIRHFHNTRKDFHKQQDTDQAKRDWCKLNGFRLIEVYDE